MEESKKRTIKKLSDAHPAEALSEINDKLVALRQLTEKSAEFGEELSGVVADLRKVPAQEKQPFIFTDDIDENEALMRAVLRDCDDITYRHFMASDRKAMLVYLLGMSDATMLEKNVLETLMSPGSGNIFPADPRQLIQKKLTAASLALVSRPTEAFEAVMTGNGLLFIDGMADIFVVGAVKYPKRSVSEPVVEDVVRGPHEAFNETIVDNVTLIRRRTNDTNLKVKIIRLGRRTLTSVAIVYIANLVKPGLLEELKRRLNLIDTERVMLSANIEELIVDHPWSPFPQVQITERPDKVIASLYEGRVAVVVDNTPFVLIVPCTYIALMQSPEDYTTQPLVASLIRFSRHLSAFLAVYLPAIYISIVSYHPGMLPTSLAISIAELRTRTPFPSFLEAVFMETILEIFQEAITRLPKKIAGAAGVVGALVIGTTVVQAGLVNPLLVVVVALTAIASFTMPTYNYALALRFLRLPILFLASVLGLYGVMLGYLFITVHMCSMRSFGESYLGSIFDITNVTDWKDMLVRLPMTMFKNRPLQYGPQEKKRMGEKNG